MDSNAAAEDAGANWPLDKLTDAELSRRLAALRERLSVAAEVPGGSEQWRALELEMADIMGEQADRVRVRRAVPAESLLVASELYAYCDRP